jgi:hypothetical protein
VINLKRRIALVLTVMMLIAVLFPVQSLAAGEDSGLEKAVKTAKSMFDIPEDFKFNYNVGSEGTKKIWYMNWTSKDGIQGDIHVTVDDNGNILYYYRYKPRDYSGQRKFPNVSKKEAKEIADNFIKKVNPGVFPNIRYEDDNGYSLRDYEYIFRYIRIVQGIPFYNNEVYVSVDSNTGEVVSYNYNWSDDIEFPGTDKIISVEQAQQAYREKLGLKLIYTYNYEGEKIKVSAIYTPKYSNYSYGIDAVTGEKVSMEGGYYRHTYDEEAAKDMAIKQESGAGSPVEVPLTPEELEAIKEASKLISLEDAEKIARGLKAVELTDGFKLTYSNLSPAWPEDGNFQWHLSFNKEATAEDKEYGYASVTLDAKTGEVFNFYRSVPYKEGEKAKYDLEASKAAVEAFLKEFKADKFSKTVYDDVSEGNLIIYMERYPENEPPRQYSFRYIREINGVEFPANGFTVEFDAVNGKVSSFNMNWYNVAFPAVDKVLSIDSVYEKLFSEIGLELQYRGTNPPVRPLTISEDGKQEKAKAMLVYAIKEGKKPYNFDANTGGFVYSDGTPYKEIKPVEYTDIDGHFAEKHILTLAEYGVSFEGNEFRPNENITQKDFLTLLSKVLNSYYGPVIVATSSQKDIDSLYNFMIREGIVKEGEKAPDSPVAREDGVKFIIRALKYDKVADIKGIFNIVFADADKINPSLVGYIAIASGLEIISGYGGSFRPKDNLTRAETAVMIYNYLQN